MKTLRIDLGDRSYDILIGRGILGQFSRHLPGSFKRAVLVTNPDIQKLYGAAVQTSLSSAGMEVLEVLVPEGETHKTLEDAATVYDFLLANRCDRKTLIVALGGGVIGDLSGFVAATYQRGVPYIQIPTTLLSQVDSSVGGKTAVNHPRGKNMIGAFYQPRLVLADVDTLSSLPPDEFRCGLAEIIKYGVIEDPALFAYLEQNVQPILQQDTGCLEHIIQTSCAIKAQVVERDETESNYRMVLNFGHTLGHAVESLTGYKQFKHGEAVAIGMVYAAKLSRHLGKCDEETVNRIESLVQAYGLPHTLPEFTSQQYIDAMRLDKKAHDAMIRFILVHSLGSVEIVDQVTETDLAAVLS